MTSRRLGIISFSLLAVVSASLAAISASGDPDAYVSWPMVSLWAVTALCGTATCLWRHIWRRPVVAALHAALLLILAGALLTHFTGRSEDIHLRIGEPGSHGLTLEAFDVETRPGSGVPVGYTCRLTAGNEPVLVALNSPACYRGETLLLSSFDSDVRGVVITASSDPWGLGCTYLGYLLLFVAAIGYFMTPHTAWRAALRRLTVVAILALPVIPLRAARLAPEVSSRLSSTAVFHNDRVTTVGTLARDLASTIGAPGAPMETLEGLLFDFGSWRSRRIVKVKSGELRQKLGITDKRASYDDFMHAVSTGRIDPASPDDRAAFGPDLGRFDALLMAADGTLLKLFPVKNGDNTAWVAADNNLPAGLDDGEWLFIRKYFSLLGELTVMHDTAGQLRLLDALERYQRRGDAAGMPSRAMLRLDNVYGCLASSMLPPIASAVAGLLLFVLLACGWRHASRVAFALNAVLFIWLMALAVIRWIVSGHVPVGNGYETMMFMAWCLSLIGIATMRNSLIPAMSLLGAGLAMCVASMGGAWASVSPLMPVLNSPLLSVHVMLVMSSYALFLLMALNGILALCRRGDDPRADALSRVMLYPGLLLLACGIFVGAVWANVSWGRYWGWDPKEVWALITMLVYSFPAHQGLLPRLSAGRGFHIYSIAAFFSVLVTYFGVNFFLGGLHSYA